jgi:hypothetical protein
MHKQNYKRIHETNNCTYRTILLLLPYYNKKINTLFNSILSLIGRHLPRIPLEMARRRVKFSLPYISPKTWLLWQEEVMAMQDARREKVASLPQLPYVSTAGGIQTHPSSEHLGSLALCFRISAKEHTVVIMIKRQCPSTDESRAVKSVS